ncbi:hypothetical protein MMSR116_08910 [Methylobacterium mesophilicum SR1.6/6]|uniref:Uncharacterized protein n=1 Tax=Methylobacterium mesophilicum SR1.6/6 TaxID=908290 RepID=A0A6B9FLE7_9HYPH|nr:hypothetical protein [Methylobacterium mesophilicum]QGY01984.1 hypothetical protein MMSR116_08910 [Methylobacterium mesophilicum SR1.6/6]
MSFEEVSAIIGIGGRKKIKYSECNYSLGPAKPRAIFRNNALEEVGFSKYFEDDLVYMDIDFFKDNEIEVVKKLLYYNKVETYETVGFLVFFSLGIALTGFHDQDEGQKSVSVFKKGVWDEMRDEMTVYKSE